MKDHDQNFLFDNVNPPPPLPRQDGFNQFRTMKLGEKLP